MQNISAKCGSTGISVWPLSQTLNQNSCIILTGYSYSQNVITKLNKKHPIYLLAGRDTVKLILKEILVGGHSLTQAILIPERSLINGQTYELKIDSLDFKEHDLTKWNSKTSKREPIRWIIKSDIKAIIPYWLKKPSVSKKTLHYYGCGPSTFVYFNCKISDTLNCLIRTTLTNLDTKTSITYYIEPTNSNIIQVGSGMCSGAFTFENGYNYEISFDLLDALLNETKWTGEKIKFTKPTEQTKAE